MNFQVGDLFRFVGLFGTDDGLAIIVGVSSNIIRIKYYFKTLDSGFWTCTELDRFLFTYSNSNDVTYYPVKQV